MSVDLPVPLRPIRPTRSPGSMERSASSRSGRSPQAAWAFIRVISGIFRLFYLNIAVLRRVVFLKHFGLDGFRRSHVRLHFSFGGRFIRDFGIDGSVDQLA